MANPLLMFLVRTNQNRRLVARRRSVPVPSEVPSTDAIFLALRRMRTPLIVLIAIFTISVVGLTLIPGHDADGNPTRVSLFESFYFISYTATTIGFGEVAPFTVGQRMWVTLTIYLTVVGWAYAIATSLSLLQDDTFREAIGTGRFQRRVRRLREPFVIVAGYGQAGRQVARELDRLGRRVVVIDADGGRIDRLAAEGHFADAPGLEGDAGVPGVLGMAGLGSRHCRGVLALTSSDDTNLAVVMATTLLRPDIPVIARCHDRVVEERMADFGAAAVINPGDRYGAYLVLALQRPATSRLVTWLLAGEGAPLPEVPDDLAAGRWVVASDGQFGEEVSTDLRAAGLTVDVIDPRAGHPDVKDAVGFIAGTDVDTLNLALAEHARHENPNLFVSVLQRSAAQRSLVEALEIDAVYTPTDLVAGEALGRVVTPVFWDFVEHAVQQDDAWAADILARLRAACGDAGPARSMVTLDRHTAPALLRWVGHSSITVGDLMRDPDDRELVLDAVALLHLRGGERTYAPGADVALRPGDQVLFAGRTSALARMAQTLDYDSIVEYVVTGHRIPDGWLWRRLTGARGRAELRATRR